MASEVFLARESSVNTINAEGRTVRLKSDGLPEGTHFHKMRVDGSFQGMIDFADRKIVLVNINGVDMPFYLSTGQGRKYSVESGKWYPFFGLDPDGWFNKGSEEDINDYYGSVNLRNVAQALDKKWGDIRNTPKGKKVAYRFKDNPTQFESIRSQVNRDMEKPVYRVDHKGQKLDYAEAKVNRNEKAYYERIKRIIKKIGG